MIAITFPSSLQKNFFSKAIGGNCRLILSKNFEDGWCATEAVEEETSEHEFW